MAANGSSVNTADIITALGNAFKDPSGAASLPNDRLAPVLLQNMNQLNDLASQGELDQQQFMQPQDYAHQHNPRRQSRTLREMLLRQLPLREGRVVAFHPPPNSGKGTGGISPEDTIWIMAQIVKSFHQDKYRYEVEDIEPEDGKPLRYSVMIRSTPISIIPLPDEDAPPGNPAHLSAYQEFSTRATVMALYPDTSCFYRAEVIASRMSMPTRGRGSGKKYYKLRFEDDDDQEHLISAAEVLEWPGQANSTRNLCMYCDVVWYHSGQYKGHLREHHPNLDPNAVLGKVPGSQRRDKIISRHYKAPVS